MLKVGIIGSGFGLYGLLPAFNYIKDCQVICICGKQTDRLLRYCEDINLKNIYSDWKEMLENEELDAVALAVTPNAQYEIAKVAIEKKINIFAEKPFEEENGNNLKFVGGMVIFIAILFHIAGILSVVGEKFSLGIEGLVILMGFLSLVINPYIFAGLILVVIGEVILHGVRMKQEIDLTV